MTLNWLSLFSRMFSGRFLIISRLVDKFWLNLSGLCSSLTSWCVRCPLLDTESLWNPQTQTFSETDRILQLLQVLYTNSDKYVGRTTKQRFFFSLHSSHTSSIFSCHRKKNMAKKKKQQKKKLSSVPRIQSVSRPDGESRTRKTSCSLIS